MGESADMVFLRQHEQILEEYNATTASVTHTGAEVRLTPRLVDYILRLVEGRGEDEARALQELLREAPAEAEPLDELALRRSTDEETAGQEPDPTTLGYWYGTCSRNALIPMHPSGWLGTAWRRLRRLLCRSSV